ncbi:MAG: hypothetical protein ACKOSQ_09950 [Planctomycetaceae bacterium]
MLVVTANWAFTDGTVAAAAGRARAARGWLRDVRLAAIRAGFGRDGRYRPPAHIDIVLAGDTFDCLASTGWRGGDRPWRGGARAAGTGRRVLLGCARHAAPWLAGLARFARAGLAVPAADRRGRPAPAAVARVPVRVALLAGDRDRQVAEAAAWITARGATVAPAWSDGSVLVRHGHEFDPACHVAHAETRERPPTLAESVTIDLVTAFASRLADSGVQPRATAPLVEALVAAGRSAGPAALAAWSTAAGPATALGDATRRHVEATWARAVEAWLRVARREPPDCGTTASPLESLAAWFCAAAAAPPPALAPLFDTRPPVAAAATGPGRGVVFGHPASSRDAATVCLGRPAPGGRKPVAVVRAAVAADVACVVAAPAAGPATVTCRSAGDRLEWHWPGGDGLSEAEPGTAPALVVDAA